MQKRKYILLGLISVVLATTAVFAGDIEMKINGATDAVTIDKSDGSEAMRVTADGKVGIGTSTPETGLSIENGIVYNDVLAGSLKSQVTIGKVSQNGALGLARATDGLITGLLALENGTNDLILLNSSGGSAIHFANSVQKRMTIATSGNVGIGTVNPAEELHVKGKLLLEGNTSFAPFRFSQYGTTAADNHIRIGTDSGHYGDAAMEIYQSNINNNVQEPGKVVINGNLGVGTKTPTEKLELVASSAMKHGAMYRRYAHSLKSAGANTPTPIVLPDGSPLDLKANYKITAYVRGTNSTTGIGAYLIPNGVGHKVQLIFGPSNRGASNIVDIVDAGTDEPAFIMAHTSLYTIEYILESFGDSAINGKPNWIGETNLYHETNTGKVGIGTVTPTEKLHVDGTALATAHTTTSDRRLKTNFTPIESALDKITQLNGVEFDWNELSKQEGKHDVGVIAQEIEAVFPQFVSEGSDGYLSVDYAKLTAPMIEAIKELKTSNDNLKEINEIMREEICSMKPSSRLCR